MKMSLELRHLLSRKLLTNLNNSGAIVGTATYTQQGTNDPIPAGQHGVMLLPLQLKLLNGITPDFDGNIPTSFIAPPEFPEYEYELLMSDIGNVTNLGPLAVGPSGSGNLHGGYFYCLMVAGQAPANIPNIQYRWKRYWKGRQWYLNYNNSTGEWIVTNRSSWGTLPGEAPLGHDDSGSDGTCAPSDSTPSINKHEFYAADTPGLNYPAGDGSDSSCQNGDYLDEEETFTYKIQYSFNGTNWQDGTSLIFHHQITLEFKQNYTGNPTNDLDVKTNSISNGDNNPEMTPTKAAFIVGSGHVTLENAHPTED
jgi:hypothetical protein